MVMTSLLCLNKLWRVVLSLFSCAPTSDYANCHMVTCHGEFDKESRPSFIFSSQEKGKLGKYFWQRFVVSCQDKEHTCLCACLELWQMFWMKLFTTIPVLKLVQIVLIWRKGAVHFEEQTNWMDPHGCPLTMRLPRDCQRISDLAWYPLS